MTAYERHLTRFALGVRSTPRGAAKARQRERQRALDAEARLIAKIAGQQVLDAMARKEAGR